MTVEVYVNNLTDFAVDEDVVSDLFERLVREESAGTEIVSVAFVGDERMKEMNEKYYNEDGTTDVLTFDYGDGSIEITVNPHQHHRQAPDVGNTLNEETIENLIHGFLHTCGFDHLNDEGEHLQRQRTLLTRFLDSSPEPSLISVTEDVSA